MQRVIVILLTIIAIGILPGEAAADSTTYHRFQTIKRHAKERGETVKFDGFSCSCSVTCKLGAGPFRTAGWGFARDYSDATDIATEKAKAKCTSKSKKIKKKLIEYTIRGEVLGAADCDEKEQCLVHYTKND